MTTNKPGSVNQQPLYGCKGCYEDFSWPAGDLRVYETECWCDLCWGERRWTFPGLPYWDDLKPYTPALQAECERLRKDVTALVDALEEISDPIRFMKERLGEGERLNGMVAVQLAEDASYLRGIARAALTAFRQGGEA